MLTDSLSLELQNPYKVTHNRECICYPPGSSWSMRACFKQGRRKGPIPKVVLWSFYIHFYTHTQMPCTHSTYIWEAVVSGMFTLLLPEWGTNTLHVLLLFHTPKLPFVILFDTRDCRHASQVLYLWAVSSTLFCFQFTFLFVCCWFLFTL